MKTNIFRVIWLVMVWLGLSSGLGMAQPWARGVAEGKVIPQLVSPEELPVGGTFWSVQRTNLPPWPTYPPFLREQQAPVAVYLVDAERNVYAVDDTQVDYEAIAQQRAEEKMLRQVAFAAGLLSKAEYWALEGGEPQAAREDYPTNALYLEITGRTTNAEISLIVRGTVPGQDYALLSKMTLTNAGWQFEQMVTGATNQDWTPALAPVGTRTNELYFWAISLGDSDADTIPDFWELEHGLDPNDPADADADPDGDGYSNREEFLLGQDPHVADPPRPVITIAAPDASAGEPNNPGVITLTRSGVTTRALPVYYTVYGSARAGVDYVALRGEAVFGVGQSTVDLVIQPIDDHS